MPAEVRENGLGRVFFCFLAGRRGKPMSETVQATPDKTQTWYARLDRALLYLLAGEVGYATLLVIFGLVSTLVAIFARPHSDFFQALSIISLLAIIYFLALPLNMLGGFLGLVLSLRMKGPGAPGAGILLNWIFIATGSWLAIFLFLLLFTTFMR